VARIAEQMRETKRINVAREKTKRGNSDKMMRFLDSNMKRAFI